MALKPYEYHDQLLFEEHPTDPRYPGFIEVYSEHMYLRLQREALGLTQQEVATKAGIDVRQYQRLESGERYMSASSLRIGLAVCDVLQLDPHRFVPMLEE